MMIRVKKSATRIGNVTQKQNNRDCLDSEKRKSQQIWNKPPEENVAIQAEQEAFSAVRVTQLRWTDHTNQYLTPCKNDRSKQVQKRPSSNVIDLTTQDEANLGRAQRAWHLPLPWHHTPPYT